MVAEAPFPRCATFRPPGDVGGATAARLSPAADERVRMPVVRVEGEPATRSRTVPAFAVGHDLVVTNAHVVAGERQTSVFLPDGDRRSARVVALRPAAGPRVLPGPDLGLAPLAARPRRRAWSVRSTATRGRATATDAGTHRREIRRPRHGHLPHHADEPLGVRPGVAPRAGGLGRSARRSERHRGRRRVRIDPGTSTRPRTRSPTPSWRPAARVRPDPHRRDRLLPRR